MPTSHARVEATKLVRATPLAMMGLLWIWSPGCALVLQSDFQFDEDDAGARMDAWLDATDARADVSMPLDAPALDAVASDAPSGDGPAPECVTPADCPARDHAIARCETGRCAYACAEGRGDCNGVADDGCEVDLATDRAHCGGCGARCEAAGAVGRCVAGICELTCASGRANCDTTSPDCETELGRDDNCSTCGDACAAGTFCDSAFEPARCASTCSGTTCGTMCVDLQTNPSHCGACDRRCTGGSASWSCAAGDCVIAGCDVGFGDCDRLAATGCETNLVSSVEHCGRCGNACMLANATPACAGGSCVVASCDDGFANCNVTSSDGCEVDLRTSVEHCGGCRRPCMLANATPACVGGACAVARCDAGFGDCDGSAANGCETEVRSTVEHCGRCGNACMLANATPACVGGACAVARCDAGFGDCDGSATNGCEASLATSRDHCGACGNACALGEACIEGVCDPVRDVASGEQNGCAVRESGRVYCWGENEAGQLGSGVLVPRGPVRVPGVSAVRVVVGIATACALEPATSTGRVLCWGRGLDGELAHGASGNRGSPAPIEEDDSGADFVLPFRDLVAFVRGGCALDSAGQVWCWGRNEVGQLGRGGTLGMPYVALRAGRVVGLPAGIVELASGRDHTCARTGSGEVWCWGRNTEGQLGRGTTSTGEATPARVASVVADAIRSGSHTVCARTASQVVCWGSNSEGQMGMGVTSGAVPTPTSLSDLPAARPDEVRLAGAQAFVRYADRWYGAGYRQYGSLGDGVGARYTTFTELPRLRGADLRTRGGVLQGFAIRDGRLEGFGYDVSGQTGTRDDLARNRPGRVRDSAGDLAGVTAVSVGEFVTAFVAGAEARAAGWNAYSQLGVPSASWLGRGAADAIGSFVSPVHGVALLERATCAIVGAVGSRRVQCLGSNANGELGRPGSDSVAPVDASLPTMGGADVVAIGAGSSHVCAIVRFSDDQRIPYCWGRNDIGQLGRGTTSSSPVFEATPAPVVGMINDAVQVATGNGHTCVLRASGRVACFGQNSNGQLGIGTTTNSATPTDVGLASVTRLTAGHLHTCALTAGNDLYCWGYNAEGNLGIPPGGNQTSPVRATVLDTLGTIHAIGAGSVHTCAAVGPSRALYCWGDNTFGQLGHGVFGGRSLSAVDTGLRDVVQVVGSRGLGGSPRRTCAVTESGAAYCWGHCTYGRCATGEPFAIGTPTPVLLDF